MAMRTRLRRDGSARARGDRRPAVGKKTGKSHDPGTRMRRKEYERELRRPARRAGGDAGVGQGAPGAKICIVFEGRDTAGKGGTIKAHHRAGQPARVPRRRAARADRAREVADVHPALHPALPGRRRGRDLRPQLVQPRRRRAGDGLLHARSRPSGSSSWCPAVEKAMVDSGIILLKYWLEVSPEEQTRRLESRIDDPRKIWKLSRDGPEVLQPLVRLLPGPRRDVRGDRHRVGALVRRAHRRQEARRGSTSSATCSSQVPYEPLDARGRRAAEAPEGRRLPRARPCRAAHPDAVLSSARDEEEVMNDNPGAAAGWPPPRRTRPGTRWRRRGRGRLGVDPASGLSAAEAQQRLQEYGPNALAAAKQEPVWKRFFKHYRDYMQIVLVVAALVSLLIGEYGTAIGLAAADAVQRVAGLPPGGQGRSGRGLPGADDEVDGQGAARRRRRGDPRRADRARRHRGGRRRRPRPRRRPDHPGRDPADRGGRPDRRERRGREGHRRHRPARRRHRRPR